MRPPLYLDVDGTLIPFGPARIDRRTTRRLSTHAATSPFAWLDDELTPPTTSTGSDTTTPPLTRLVRVDSTRGVGDAGLTALEQWYATLSPPPTSAPPTD